MTEGKISNQPIEELKRQADESMEAYQKAIAESATPPMDTEIELINRLAWKSLHARMHYMHKRDGV